jgi:hypothetical protein
LTRDNHSCKPAGIALRHPGQQVTDVTGAEGISQSALENKIDEAGCLDHEDVKAREEHEARSSRGKCALQRTPSYSSCFVLFVPFASS